MSAPRIAVIDDSMTVRDAVTFFFASSGYTVVFHDRAADADAFIEQQQPGVALIDLHLEYADAGLDLVRRLRAGPATAGLPIVMWSADPQLSYKVSALGLADIATVSKYSAPQPLLAAVEQALGVRSL